LFDLLERALRRVDHIVLGFGGRCFALRQELERIDGDNLVVPSLVMST